MAANSAGVDLVNKEPGHHFYWTAMGDLVASWDIPLADGVHRVEFEHGTTTGKRIIRVDDKEIYRVEWMFKLVGKEHFSIGKANCAITIDAVSGFAYEYALEVNGKSLKKFRDNQSKIQRAWIVNIAGNRLRVCLEKTTMDVWVEGEKLDTVAEFGENGTETHFQLGERSAVITAMSSGKKKTGIVHTLWVADAVVEECSE